jgi:hypothetical protein
MSGKLSDTELTDVLDGLDGVTMRALAAGMCGADEGRFVEVVRQLQPDALPERLRGSDEVDVPPGKDVRALAGVGPYETSDQAAGAVRDVYEAMRLGVRGTMGRANLDRLTSACATAGVELGAYDRRIVEWLAGWEPETVAVIAGLILRANGGVR